MRMLDRIFFVFSLLDFFFWLFSGLFLGFVFGVFLDGFWLEMTAPLCPIEWVDEAGYNKEVHLKALLHNRVLLLGR